MGGSQSSPKESRWFPAFASELPTMAGKVVVVTGTTSGTGFVCARTCARKGARVVVLNRESERSAAALKAILDEAPGADVTSVACDLSSFASVREAVAFLKESCKDSGIDVVACNAGVMALADAATVDGYDVQSQTNHLSHFLLVKELFPLLERAAELRGEARVVNHSSSARNVPPGALEGRYFEKNGGHLGGNGASMFFGGARWQRYHQTKLANAVFTVTLAAKLEARGSKVKCMVVAPGLATTNLQHTTASDGGFSGWWLMRFAQSAEDGAMPLLHCCAGRGVKSGELWVPSGMGELKGPPGLKKLESACTEARAGQVLWEASEKACGEWKL